MPSVTRNPGGGLGALNQSNKKGAQRPPSIIFVKSKIMLPQHLAITDQHPTPPWLFPPIRKVMGWIDLDPCTSQEINDWSVKAEYIFDEEGLESLDQVLFGEPLKAWCNPPGGKTGNKSNLLLWLEAMHRHWLQGKIEQFFFLFFNPEFISGTPNIDLSHIPMLHFYNRLKFWSFDPLAGTFREGNYQKVGAGGKYLRKFNDHWEIIGINGVVTHSQLFDSKKEAIAAAGDDYWIWTNSPVNVCTLAYFPPRTNSGWAEQTAKLSEAFPAEWGRWVIPQFPSDLQAK
jgi:hypothetical protein